MEIDDGSTTSITHDLFSLEVRHDHHDHDEHHHQRRPLFYSSIPKFIGYDDPTVPIEAMGCAVDMSARAVVFMATIFWGPGLLELASDQATENCSIEEDDDKENECRVYGFKPRSLLSNIAMVPSAALL
jgi:hypothetical protein